MPASVADAHAVAAGLSGNLLIELDSATDEAGFRRAVRYLMHHGYEPLRVAWRDPQQVAGDLFDAPLSISAANMPLLPAVALPKWFGELTRVVVLHSAPDRFARLYELAWRLHQRQTLAGDALDTQRLQLDEMARAVRREMHKMTAFVRFTKLPSLAVDSSATGSAPADDVGQGSAARYVAWFEPAHNIVAATAPFFVKRFAQMRWAILTPRGSVQWDGKTLQQGPAAQAEQAPIADAGEALWLTYYRSIFNPARLKVAMMKKEMPVRFWKNLPEAAQISDLIANAAQLEGTMIEASHADRRVEPPFAAKGRTKNQSTD